MHYFVTEMCTNVHISVTKWCIVKYVTGVLWDLWDWSINVCLMVFVAWFQMQDVRWNQNNHAHFPRLIVVSNLSILPLPFSVTSLVLEQSCNIAPLYLKHHLWRTRIKESRETLRTAYIQTTKRHKAKSWGSVIGSTRWYWTLRWLGLANKSQKAKTLGSTLIRHRWHFRVESMSNRRRTGGLCHLGWCWEV